MIQPLSLTSVAVNLRRLFPGASFVGCGDIRATAVSNDSQACRPGTLFAALRGHRVDGHDYIPNALQCGASALLVERPQALAAVPQCVVPDTRRAYAELCAALHGNPSREMGVVGVTGTNGKTTTTWMVRKILQLAGRETGILGTIEYSDGERTERSHLTTPDADDISSWLAAMLRRRTMHAAMELSSHALEQQRAAGTQLDVAIITNITQDHFDYHHDLAAYRASKLKIFGHLKSGGLSVINADEPGSVSCMGSAPGKVLTYGLEQPADVSAQLLEETLFGSRFRMRLCGETIDVRTGLIGRHNISNCLAAAAAAAHLGVSTKEIAAGLEALTSVPGRMEAVECGQAFGIFVDYAHTDDALRRCLSALRQLTAGRVICVFGAGGDRDRTKRPLLGKAAGLADIAVVTSDNPRSEDPQQIIRDVLAGFPAAAPRPYVEVDREQAIAWAIAQAEPGDCVLVAGKGHETEQIIGSERRHFDDRDVVRRQFRAGPHIYRGNRRDSSRTAPLTFSSEI